MQSIWKLLALDIYNYTKDPITGPIEVLINAFGP